MDTSTDESKEAQISRLLKEADKKKEETVEVEKTVVTDNGEKITEEETIVQNKKSHKGMTRGEIMEYEMTRETDLLNPINMVQQIHAVMLSGGSAFGLDAASGAMQYLEEHGVGLDICIIFASNVMLYTTKQI